MNWQVLPHTADYAFRVFGKSFPELLRNSAFALMESMFDAYSENKSEPQTISIEINSLDPESLLIDWLREIHYHIVVDKMLFVNIQLEEVTDVSLRAILKYRHLTERDANLTDIKAVTYHNIEIKEEAGKLHVDIVCDV
jgi:SHS2 domain-containing protein